MQTPLPPQCAAKFRADKLLASGGFGSVWLAHQTALDRQVAIKVLHGETLTDPETVDRFLNEARITASLNHPNIVKIIDHGVDSGVPWIAYEYVAGQSLRKPVQAGGLPWPDAVRAAVQIASALAEAHRQGILHRDIKPDNVLEADKGHYKVADFGVAKWSAEGAVKTQVGVILGTPAYLSPTQVSGQPPCPQSDFYALGVCLYELLTGRVPLYDENLAELLRLHRSEPVPAPSRFTPAVPKTVDRIVLKLLAKPREERYASGAELIADLEAALEGAPAASPGAPGLKGSGSFRRARGETRAVSGIGSASAQTRAVAAPAPAAGMRLSALAIGAALAMLAIVVASRARGPEPAPSPSSSNVAVIASPSAVASPPVLVAPDGSEMVLVTGGAYLIDTREEEAERGQTQRVELADFYMDRLEVTNAQYAAFLKAQKRDPHGPSEPAECYEPTHPVIRVNWDEASEYLAWTGKRLPTEFEWQVAARGRTRSTFPWGESIERAAPQANLKDVAFQSTGGSSGLDLGLRFNGDDKFPFSAPVGRFPSGASPWGILDLAGNVSEWCADEWPKPGFAQPGMQRKRVVRGGGWDDNEIRLRTNTRRGEPQQKHNRSLGFRGVVSAAQVDARFKPRVPGAR